MRRGGGHLLTVFSREFRYLEGVESEERRGALGVRGGGGGVVGGEDRCKKGRSTGCGVSSSTSSSW